MYIYIYLPLSGVCVRVSVRVCMCVCLCLFGFGGVPKKSDRPMDESVSSSWFCGNKEVLDVGNGFPLQVAFFRQPNGKRVYCTSLRHEREFLVGKCV